MASNTTLFVKDSTLTKVCLQENIMFDMLIPSLLACTLLCSRQSACQWVRYKAGTNACLACNDDSSTSTVNNVSAAVFYEKDDTDSYPCPSDYDWIKVGPYYYKTIAGPINWYTAKSQCERLYHAILVELDTHEEQMNVCKRLRNCKGGYWTGGQYEQTGHFSTANKWQWSSTGHVITYNDSLWAPDAVEEAKAAAKLYDAFQVDGSLGCCMKRAYGYKLSACYNDEMMGAVCKQT